MERHKNGIRKGHANDEIQDGFILRPGRLRHFAPREREAALHLIGGFAIGNTPDGLMLGTVVWLRGNNKGFKVPGGTELGPEQLGTGPRGFWTRLPDDLKQTMRIDRQDYFNYDGKRFCNYQLQVGSDSIACALVLVDTMVGARVMRRAFNKSLETEKNVMIYPTNPRKGYMYVEQ
jgi:hypothetical protein